MENNKPKKDYLNIVLYILIGIIIILCVLLVVKIIDARKIVDEKEEKEPETVIVVDDGEVIPNQQEDDPEVSTGEYVEVVRKEYQLDSSNKGKKLEKIYNDKPLIYTAEYKYESSYDVSGPSDYNSFKDYIEVDVTNMRGIKVPYINIKNNNAGKANNTLKEKYTEMIKYVEDSKICESSDTASHMCGNSFLNYVSYESKDIVSVVVFYGNQVTDIPHTQYITYSFDKKTGNYMGISEIAKNEGMSVEDLKEATKKAINNKIDALGIQYNDNEAFNTYKEDTIKNFENGFNKYENNCVVVDLFNCFQGVQYYYDNNEKLHAMVTIHMQYGLGRRYWHIEI